MLDTALAHSRHYPAINWSHSYSLYSAGVTSHFAAQVSPAWGEMQQRCRELLQREATLREVAEIVGAEGLQDADRLLMMTTERIRSEFLRQNAYSDDAFCSPSRRRRAWAPSWVPTTGPGPASSRGFPWMRHWGASVMCHDLILFNARCL